MHGSTLCFTQGLLTRGDGDAYCRHVGFRITLGNGLHTAAYGSLPANGLLLCDKRMPCYSFLHRFRLSIPHATCKVKSFPVSCKFETLRCKYSVITPHPSGYACHLPLKGKASPFVSLGRASGRGPRACGSHCFNQRTNHLALPDFSLP